MLKKPGQFREMTYADAINFCREHKIYKDDKEQTFFEFGDVCFLLPLSGWMR